MKLVLKGAIAPLRNEPGRTWQRIEPSLEDVFIHLMQSRAADAPAEQRRTADAQGLMIMSEFFSFSRWLGIVGKEFIQLKRDRLTFGMIVGIPVVQLVLFGFAINSDPKHLPAMLIDADRSEFSRSIAAALRNSDYFHFVGEAGSER
jgi:hypothetical protein